MPDREKVLNGLNKCLTPYLEDCVECPYFNGVNVNGECNSVLLGDALELLKGHEPLLIKRDTVDEIYNYVAECPNCGIRFSAWEDEKIRYCPGCGRKVKWDAETGS